MRLKNKKTGKIIEIVIVDHGDEWGIRNVYTDESIQTYDSLAKLNEEWEDAPEEPKGIKEIFFTGATVFIAMHNQKEAIEMEEKLKALERLKDKGFKFESWDYDGGNYQERIRTGRILFRVKDYEEVEGLLNMVFGDEE